MEKEDRLPKMYQFRITLKYTDPPVRRRIQVPGNLDLIDLHHIIQVFMGWDNDHLFVFEVGGVRYEDSGEAGRYNVREACETPISRAFPRKRSKGTYIYDFGDNWEHELLVEEIIDPEPGVRYPVCTDGKGRCPPEDCGGAGGYHRLLTVLKDPTHEEYNDMLEWIGGDIDPEEFDCEAVNDRLPGRRVLVKADGG